MHKLFVIPSITLFRSLSAVALAKADAFCASLRLKNPRNLRNPWLINDLRAYNALYNCRETFTTVMSALQINLFMQNKANFRKVKLNVNNVLTRDYEQMDTWSIGKTKPIQSQSKPIKANKSQLKPIKCQNKANSNPIYPVVASGEAGTNPISKAKNENYRPTWAVCLQSRPQWNR